MLLACLFSLPARAAVPPDVVEIAFHADLDGRLAAPRCGRSLPERPDYARLAGALRTWRADAPGAPDGEQAPPDAAAKAPPALAVLGGNVLGPAIFSFAAFEQSPDRAAATFARMFERVSYDAFTIGSHDLGLHPAWLEAFVGEMSRRRVPLVGGNLRCDSEAQATRPGLCAALGAGSMVTHGSTRVGIVATLSPQLRPMIPGAAARGLTFDPPLPVVRAATDKLRAAGADVVVWLAEVPSNRAGLDELRGQQLELATGHGPDVVFVSGLADADGARTIRLLRQDGAPTVVGSTTGATSATVAAVSRTEGRAVVTARALPAASAEPDAGVRALLLPLIAAYCDRYRGDVGTTRTRSVTREAFIGYVLEIMRRHAGTEIALINRGFVKQAPFPLAGDITRADLAEAMPYAAPLGTARVSGAVLADTIVPALASGGLAAVGLERDAAGKVTVNGRPIDKTRGYRITTVRFVAEGGDGLVPASALTFSPLAAGSEIRELVESFIRSQAGARDGDGSVDPAADFGPPPAQRSLLLATGDVGFDVASTRINNGAEYTDAQLTRAEQRTIRAELTSLVALRAPRHDAEARLAIKYGRFNNQPAGQPAVSGESDDLVVASSTYSYRAFVPGDGRPRPLRPDPYVRTMLEAELTRPPVTADQTRDYRHAELTATIGALVGVMPKLKLRAGAGARKELLASGDPGRARPVLEAGGVLDQIALLTAGPAVVRLEGSADWVFVDPGGAAEHQLRAFGRLSVPLLPTLFFTAGIDVFAVREQMRSWGYATDVKVGLRIHLDRVHQRL